MRYAVRYVLCVPRAQKGNTPLLLAAERGHAGVTAVLLAAGANKSSGNKVSRACEAAI